MDSITLETDPTSIGKNNCSRRLLHGRLQDFFVKHRVLTQCYVAAMLFIVNTIYLWKNNNIIVNWFFGRYEPYVFFPMFKNRTLQDVMNLFYGSLGGAIFFQVPGALLIYGSSSHRFLTATVVISSIWHLVTPLVSNSAILVFLTLAQIFMEAPLQIAVLSMWKDWAPPGQRTIFVFLSFSSWILMFLFASILGNIENLYTTGKNFYIAGACGIVWSFFWNFTVPVTPPADSEYPQNDQPCVQSDTTVKRSEFSKVPWKRIVTSMPVFALCLISFKIGSSFTILNVISYLILRRLELTDKAALESSNLLFAIVCALCFACGAIITHFLSIKYPRMIQVRKGLLCGALITHAILLLGTLIPIFNVQFFSYCLSYCIFFASLAGFITNALDLSTQYVSIIGGFMQFFYLLGLSLSNYYIYSGGDYTEKLSMEKILCYEVVFTIIVAVIFRIWGSLEEQQWSIAHCSQNFSVIYSARTGIESNSPECPNLRISTDLKD